MVLLKSVLVHITNQPLHARLSTYTCPMFRCLNLQSAFVAFCCILVSCPDFELLFIYTTLTFWPNVSSPVASLVWAALSQVIYRMYKSLWLDKNCYHRSSNFACSYRKLDPCSQDHKFKPRPCQKTKIHCALQVSVSTSKPNNVVCSAML